MQLDTNVTIRTDVKGIPCVVYEYCRKEKVL